MAISAAAASLIAAGIGAAASTGTTIATNAKNMRIARYQAEQNAAFTREMNEYNAPKNQLQRYIDAGLNPNLMYGDSANAGNQSTPVRQDVSYMQAPDVSGFQNLIGTALNYAMQRQQIQKVEQETQIAKEQELYLRSQRMMQEMRNLEESTLLGVDPGLVWIKGERELAGQSLKIQRYRAELKGIEELNSLRESQKALNSVEQTLKGLKANAQSYYNTNIQPLVKDSMTKIVEGKTIENELLEIEKKFRKFDKYFGYGERLFKDIIGAFGSLRGFGGGFLRSNQPDFFGGWSPSPTW